jgi:hypothetical protein
MEQRTVSELHRLQQRRLLAFFEAMDILEAKLGLEQLTMLNEEARNQMIQTLMNGILTTGHLKKR